MRHANERRESDDKKRAATPAPPELRDASATGPEFDRFEDLTGKLSRKQPSAAVNTTSAAADYVPVSLLRPGASVTK